jgi:hypothetical protein
MIQTRCAGRGSVSALDVGSSDRFRVDGSADRGGRIEAGGALRRNERSPSRGDPGIPARCKRARHRRRVDRLSNRSRDPDHGRGYGSEATTRYCTDYTVGSFDRVPSRRLGGESPPSRQGPERPGSGPSLGSCRLCESCEALETNWKQALAISGNRLRSLQPQAWRYAGISLLLATSGEALGVHGKQGVCHGLPPVAGDPLPAKEGVDLLKTPSPANPKAHRT